MHVAVDLGLCIRDLSFCIAAKTTKPFSFCVCQRHHDGRHHLFLVININTMVRSNIIVIIIAIAVSPPRASKFQRG